MATTKPPEPIPFYLERREIAAMERGDVLYSDQIQREAHDVVTRTGHPVTVCCPPGIDGGRCYYRIELDGHRTALTETGDDAPPSTEAHITSKLADEIIDIAHGAKVDRLIDHDQAEEILSHMREPEARRSGDRVAMFLAIMEDKLRELEKMPAAAEKKAANAIAAWKERIEAAREQLGESSRSRARTRGR